MAVLIPGPLSEVTRGFTAETLISRGMTLDSKEEINIDGHTGMLVGATQDAYGISFGKWIVAFGDEQETRMVTATFRASEGSSTSRELKAIVLGTRVDDTPPPLPGADLRFTLVGSEKMKLTRGFGKMLIYSKDGVIPAKSPEDAFFIAVPSLSEVPIRDKREYAMRRLAEMPDMTIKSVSFNNKITIDGMDGYELIATAEDEKTGIPLTVYQVMLFNDGEYILVFGSVGARIEDEYLPEFKAMARSLTRKAD